jgi:iron complex transport system substrate-binding protein
VSTSTLPEGLDPAGIDAAVSAALARGEDLYRLDADALAGLDAELVVTQDLCAVCAVDVSVVDDALAHLGCTAEVLTIDPHTLEEVLDSVATLGRATAREQAAEALVGSLRTRLDEVVRRTSGRARPRTLVLEWTDPPFAPGHWIPEMVTRAGGEPTIGVAGTRSTRITWEEAEGSRPDVVVCAPCGFDLEGSTTLARDVRHRFPDVPVWAVDADGHFARPGPRLVDGVEALASILHPEPDASSAHCRRV